MRNKQEYFIYCCFKVHKIYAKIKQNTLSCQQINFLTKSVYTICPSELKLSVEIKTNLHTLQADRQT